MWDWRPSRTCLWRLRVSNPFPYFQQWMSWFQLWWRMQQNALILVNCKDSWVIKTLNVHYAFGICPKVCLVECFWHNFWLLLCSCREVDWRLWLCMRFGANSVRIRSVARSMLVQSGVIRAMVPLVGPLIRWFRWELTLSVWSLHGAKLLVPWTDCESQLSITTRWI